MFKLDEMRSDLPAGKSKPLDPKESEFVMTASMFALAGILMTGTDTPPQGIATSATFYAQSLYNHLKRMGLI